MGVETRIRVEPPDSPGILPRVSYLLQNDIPRLHALSEHLASRLGRQP